MKLLATHITRYWYSGPVSMCHTEVHLHAARAQEPNHSRVRARCQPRARFHVLSREDYFGNEVTFFSIAEPHRELIITSRCLANLEARRSRARICRRPGSRCARMWRNAIRPNRSKPASLFSNRPTYPVGPPVRRIRRAVLCSGPSVPERGRGSVAPHLHRVPLRPARHHHRDSGGRSAALAPRRLPGFRAPDDRLPAIAEAARALRERLRAQGGDFAGEEASHAWVSVWCPVFGWQDFDPTNNVMPRGEHFTVAWGRDYSDVTPVKGVALGGGEQVISVSVDVSPAVSQPSVE